MRPESADLRPKRPDLGSERAKLRQTLRLRGQISDLRGLMGGGTNKLTNGQIKEQTKVPIFYRISSPSRLLPKKLKKYY